LNSDTKVNRHRIRSFLIKEVCHFDKGLEFDEFLKEVKSILKNMKCDITYNVFRKVCLPPHRKPTFSEYARFWKIEKLMVKQ
jgi:hypothetical protein